MSILGMNGFEGRDGDLDGLITVSGNTQYTTTVPTGGSQRSLQLQLDIHRMPWFSGEINTATYNEPSGSEYWFHYHQLWISNANNNDAIILGVSRGGSEVITYSHEDTTGEPTIRVAGVVRATASGATPSSGNWVRYHIHVEGHATGDTISLYADGVLTTPILTYTLIGADETSLAAIGKPNEFYAEGSTASSTHIDNVFALDPNDGVAPTNINLLTDAHIEPSTLNADSATYTDWSGSYTDIDEVPPNDTDFISSTTVNEVSTFGHTTVSNPLVLFAQTKWRVTRTGTVAGSNMQIRKASISTPATFADESSHVAPGDGNVLAQHHTAPDGSSWSKTLFDDTEFGPVSRT